MFRLRLARNYTTSGGYRQVIAQGAAAAAQLLPQACTNQHFTTGNEANLEALVSQFSTPVETTFGYGSGVFDQAGYAEGTRSQIDLIHVVRDAASFHADNLHQHPQHYSFLRNLGGALTILQVQKWGAGVYFNPFVDMKVGGKSHLVKYGVITVEDCVRDLCEWDSLYVAGRLQKPVKYLKQQSLFIESVNQYNLQSALTLALLLAPKKFDETRLYETITLISYLGDPRMDFGGENPKKVQNIVHKQFDKFRQLYAPHLDAMVDGRTLTCTPGECYRFEQEPNSDQRGHMLLRLPIGFRRRLGLTDATSTHALAADTKYRRRLVKAVRQTVGYPAAVQAAKGVLTAGVLKSLKYAWEKNSKWRAA